MKVAAVYGILEVRTNKNYQTTKAPEGVTYCLSTTEPVSGIGLMEQDHTRHKPHRLVIPDPPLVTQTADACPTCSSADPSLA